MYLEYLKVCFVPCNVPWVSKQGYQFGSFDNLYIDKVMKKLRKNFLISKHVIRRCSDLQNGRNWMGSEHPVLENEQELRVQSILQECIQSPIKYLSR